MAGKVNFTGLLGAMTTPDRTSIQDLYDDRMLERAAAIAAVPVDRKTNEAPARVASRVERPQIRETLETIARGETLSPPQQYVAEAIILPDLRPAIYIENDSFGRVEHYLWQSLNDNHTYRANLHAAIPSIGRIELPYRRRSDIYGGTGFVVGPNVIMTNRHVAEIFATGVGERHVAFRAGCNAGFDLKRERSGGSVKVEVSRVRMIHPYWDCALLEVRGLPANAKPLWVSAISRDDAEKREVAAIGYPAFDPRNPEDVQDDLFEGEYQVKRLQPGLVQAAADVASFGKVVSAMTHDCSTLGGNSGSGLIDLSTGEVLGLHFGGSYLDRNFAVPAQALAQDSRLHDAGVQFRSARPSAHAGWIGWWESADQREAPPQDDHSADAPKPSPTRPATTSVGTSTAAEVTVLGDGGLAITVPLHVTLRLGGAVAAATETVTTDLEERLVEPIRDVQYATRTGYAPGFLAEGGAPADRKRLDVPMPKPSDPLVIAKTRAGGDTLAYQNFSVMMHASRRLALFTASNVTDEDRMRRPGGKSYSRKELTGLGKSDQEKWFLDDRLAPEFQLPDHFYQYDDKAFDKGHIVRRDDVAWGASFAEMQRANGDTYHVTNCSPQVLTFNRSNKGTDNWGDLENVVLSQAATERLCVFAGPVLSADDDTFLGRMPGGARLRVKVPSRFWKVVVARAETGLESFGFVLEQDLSAMPRVSEGMEFAPEDFAKFMVPLAEIEAMAGVVLDDAVKRVDQFERARGADIAHLADAPRRRRRSQ